MKRIKVLIFNNEVEIESGSSLLEISKTYQDKFKFPIICASVNGIYKSLTEKITSSCDICFYDLTNNVANSAYINSLIYLTLYSVKEIFGKRRDFRVEHSLDKGLFIKTKFEITDDDIKMLLKKMKEVVKMALPIEKLTVDRIEATEYFQERSYKEKTELLKYNTNTFITLYKLDYLYDYFFSLMVPDTSYLKDFGLTYLNDHSFILRFPTVFQGKVVEYKHRKNLYDVFEDSREWINKLGIYNVSDLNKIVSEGKIDDFIRMNEVIQSNKLLNVAKQIFEKKNSVKIVLIAGPSSSGKTTTCSKLCMYLTSLSMKPKMLSLDNYFKDRDKMDKLADGTYDFESINAVDLKLFNKQMEQLLNGEDIDIPTYDFISGKKVYKNKIKLEKNDILLIEGIHCLNDKLLTNINSRNKCRIYLSALSELNLDSHNRIPTSDNRLLRRIIRDSKTRGTGVDKTLELWKNVRKGEEENIFPYQDNGDFTINTALVYEIGVLKTYVEPLLYSVENTSPYYEDALRLLNFLRPFLPIPSESIPDDSILREFIGGSCFK